MELVKIKVNDEFRWGQSNNRRLKISKNIYPSRLC
jgi:hypothetical protein